MFLQDSAGQDCSDGQLGEEMRVVHSGTSLKTVVFIFVFGGVIFSQASGKLKAHKVPKQTHSFLSSLFKITFASSVFTW